MAARDSVAHDVVEDERVERIRGAPARLKLRSAGLGLGLEYISGRGAPARARAAFEDGDVFLVDLCILAIPRIEVRLDLGDLEVDSKLVSK